MVLLVLSAVVLLAPSLSFIELRALDVLYALRSEREPDPRIELIDSGGDPSVYDGLRDPREPPGSGCETPRLAYAEAVRRLSRWGAKVIVFDLMFRRSCEYEDEQLAEAFREAGNVIVAATTKTKPGAVGLEDPVTPLHEAAAVGSPVAYQAHETVRSVPLLVRDRDSGREYRALCLEAFQRFKGAGRAQAKLRGRRWLVMGDQRVPVLPGEQISLLSPGGAGKPDDSSESGGAAFEVVRGDNVEEIPGLVTWNTMLLNWVGPEGTIRPHHLSDLLAMDDDVRGREMFDGKAVIIGQMDWDAHWTAVGAMPGPEVQANALHTLMSGDFIRPISPWAMIGVLLAFSLGTSLAVRRFRGMRAIGAVVLLVGAAVVLARHPSFIGKPEAPGVGEVRTMDASILFSDIRGYTGIAEQLSAADTLTMLNTYQSAVEDVITRYGGTIVKTPGDAILAVFWKDVGDLSHATCALRSGEEILRDLPAMGRAWEAVGVSLKIGIGIDAGQVAMALVGKRHLEPTVIGDAVNVAQRLETLTKTLGCPLVFSENVRERLREDVETVCLDELTVRGRKTPLRVYGVAGPDGLWHGLEKSVDLAGKEKTE
jgi:class 3 adenylate cyclase